MPISPTQEPAVSTSAQALPLTGISKLHFDGFVVLPTERRLLVKGEPAKIGARAFDLLLTLIAARDRVVGKDELLERVWPGLVVEENNLSVHVSQLRKLCGLRAIATVPGRGYQFTAASVDAGQSRRRADRGHEREMAGSEPGLQDALRGNVPAVLQPLIGRELDHEDPMGGHYTLEVTSPGLERSLRVPAHFQRSLGKTVALRLRDIVTPEGERSERRPDGRGSVRGPFDRTVG